MARWGRTKMKMGQEDKNEEKRRTGRMKRREKMKVNKRCWMKEREEGSRTDGNHQGGKGEVGTERKGERKGDSEVSEGVVEGDVSCKQTYTHTQVETHACFSCWRERMLWEDRVEGILLLLVLPSSSVPL